MRVEWEVGGGGMVGGAIEHKMLSFHNKNYNLLLSNYALPIPPDSKKSFFFFLPLPSHSGFLPPAKGTLTSWQDISGTHFKSNQVCI